MIHIRLSVWRGLPAMLALFVLANPVSLQAIAVKGPVFTDFTFSGLCTDCSGSATATLRLQDYFQGDPIYDYNLVSFHYDGTNLLSAFTITQSGTGFSIGGMIPTSLAAWADFNISAPGGIQFSSDKNGVWAAAGPSVAPDDYGTAGLWNGETEAVPEPGAFLLVAGGIAVIGVRRWTVRT
jgi:hypothetical protein